MKTLSWRMSPKEIKDLDYVQVKLERSSKSDTMRTMLRMVKKILEKNIEISNH